ncbi:Uncharacterized iron-regulated membrane protein [Arachidicoccus rhizosphaerae]|uniref:Uncharacterized iron-regulated membrane protein n=1 Tax=Arachidicoccus rhizosphaerae TaxID=551991 RepID=A0A1H3XTT5_9BACT|nr:PepSY-associated TM helix domain-containing protein [Arachidicoccus rhizosphaerae]SEA01962.1 Uncharacterized iron-regulated membrane protein [Arachidicoccus rhizosphaerae]
MNLRNYNIYFHTHTISGIIISLILYVIFFAGSFAFFKTEIASWQKNTPNSVVEKSGTDMNRIRDTMAAGMDLYGRDLYITLNERTSRMTVSASASKDTTIKDKGGFFYMDATSFKKQDYRKSYDLGEFLYRLHFLAPLNVIGGRGFLFGYYLAGLVAFLFLFAIITGTLVHWKKIVSNFYVFRPWEKLKTLWTDIHTALGVITLPFLFVFAVTGTYYLVSFPLVTQPTAKVQYGGSTDSLFQQTIPGRTNYAFEDKKLNHVPDLNAYFKDAQQKLKGAELRNLIVYNYGDQGMRIRISAVNQQRSFTEPGTVIYNGKTGKVEKLTPIDQKGSYIKAVDSLVYSLHFGNYGGNIVRILYFLLGIAGCIVIISGVMIWLVARNKKNIPEKKRRFNEWLANIYLSASIGMYPVTAAAFIAVKLNPGADRGFVYSFYFWVWLVITILLVLRRNNYKTTRDCLLIGGLLGVAIPIVNGLVTGNWIWVSMRHGYTDILLIDLLWTVIGITSLVTWLLVVRQQQEKLLHKLSPSGV